MYWLTIVKNQCQIYYVKNIYFYDTILAIAYELPFVQAWHHYYLKIHKNLYYHLLLKKLYVYIIWPILWITKRQWPKMYANAHARLERFRIRQKIVDKQFGFVPIRSDRDATFPIRSHLSSLRGAGPHLKQCLLIFTVPFLCAATLISFRLKQLIII